MNEEKLLFIAGWVFFTFWLFATISNLLWEHPAAIFWFCNLSLLFAAFFCFFRSSLFLSFYLSHALLLQTPWILDWILYFASGRSYFGIETFYQGVSIWFMLLSFARHLLAAPFAIAVLALCKPVRYRLRDFFVWIGLFAFGYALTFLVPARYNINCVYSSCIPAFPFSGSLYTIVWFLVLYVVVVTCFFVLVRPVHRFLWNRVGKRYNTP